MIVTKEMSLNDFEFWSGAVDTANTLSYDELNEIENYLEEVYPNGMDETTINDFFWFDNDQIAEILGFEDWEDLERDHSGENEEEPEENDERDW